MPDLFPLDFTRYHRPHEVEAILHELAQRYPALCSLYSIGKSFEGRDLWLMEIGAGDRAARPGYYIDGNIHAGEVTGAATCLYTIHYLLSRWGGDSEVTALLEDVTFYILPHVSPDGVEYYLTTPHTLRSSKRPYPGEEEEAEGLVPDDVNGDGWIAQMRVPDEDGEWKVSQRDARLLIPRLPYERGGRYFRLLTAGRLYGFDGVEVMDAPPRFGLDLNRNFPVGWEPEAKQRGAGPFPLSEPESRAVAQFLVSHPNICGAMSYHTTTGIILRPSSLRPDSKMNKKDLAAFRAIGKVGEELTGYPCVSVHDGFAYDPQSPIKGDFLDWVYDHLGILIYSTELWDLRAGAGVERVPFLGANREVTEEDGLKLLRWNDRELGGDGFIPWTPFDHRQLGPVEIGGWKVKFVHQNPPPRFLPGEVHKNCLFTLRHAAASPRLAIERAQAERLGDGLFRLEVVLKNKGYLPTYVTEMAKEIKAAKPITVELSLPAGAEVVLGQAKQDAGHLEGRIAPMYWTAGPLPPYAVAPQRERRLEWVLRAAPGGRVTVTAAAVSLDLV